MRRIAVWNTAFLGDAVLTLPLVQSLRLRYPEAALDVYVRGGLAPLFAFHPAVNAVYAYDKRGAHKGLAGGLRLLRSVASRNYDLWLCPHQSLRSSLFSLASGAGMRIGYTGAVMAPLAYTHRVDRGFERLEEIERLLELLRPLGDGPRSLWPEITLSPLARERADEFFAGLTGPVLGLHPGSVWPTKRWVEHGFAHVAAKALAAGASVVLFAGPGEEAVAAKVKQLVAESSISSRMAALHDLSGTLSLEDLAAHLARLSCYLTNDSGPMHLAWAQRTPVAAVFGPTVRALGFYPRGDNSRVHEVCLDCRPCGLHGHKNCPLGHHHCMTQVDPEDVWQDVARKLWPA